jgi:hypothetical protein
MEHFGLQSAMETLVLTAALRMVGPGMPEIDTKLEQPDSELGPGCTRWIAPWRTVIDEERLRQTIVAKCRRAWCGTSWKPFALTKKMLESEHKLAKENAETNGWNVTEETTAVTEQFCAAVKSR